MEKALEKVKEMLDFCNAVGCHRAIYESLEYVQKELEEAMRKPTCETFDKGASSTNYPPKTIFAFGNYYTLKDTQC